MLPTNLAFVDIETTGLSVTRDRIIEIGILRVEDGKLVSSYQTLLHPEMHINPSIFAMTGIKLNDIENAPAFYEKKNEIFELLKDCVFVAHNVRFDYGFLRNEFARFGISYSAKHLCTVKLFKYLFPQTRRHNLDSVIEHFGLQCEDRHRAFDDAKVIYDFYNIVRKQMPEETIIKAVKLALNHPTLPINIAPDNLDRIPEQPGVYIFYGEQGSPLYIGKSVNLRERVMSHFSSDRSITKEMKIAQQIESIETITTAGELGALVKESAMIKQLQPLYNRRLRIARKLILLKRQTNTDGYDEVVTETVDKISAEEIGQILGVFRSQRHAKEFLISLAKDYFLCEKYLKLEKTKTSCFAYRLGTCKGACIQKEKPLFYNIRFLQAFSKQKLKPWPFNGAIVIKEKNEIANIAENFVIDKWCLLGSIKTNGDDEQAQLQQDYAFDLDTYKILVQYLEKRKNEKSIMTVNQEQISNFMFPVT